MRELRVVNRAAVAAALAEARRHRRAGRLAEAEAACRRVLAAEPGHPQALCELGLVAHRAKRYDRAEVLLGEAAARTPGDADAHFNLGVVLHEQDKLDAAIAEYRAALAIAPDVAEYHNNLGNALKGRDRLDEAHAAFRRALALRPDMAEAHHNLGNLERALGRLEHAVAAYRRALDHKPDVAEARRNLGLCLIQLGRFAEGAELIEARWRTGDSIPRGFARPAWDGAPAPGRTILLYAEQGIGDTIQFARYAPLVRRLCGRVVLECQAPLVRLMTTLAGVESVHAKDAALPDFDLHAPLIGMLRLFATTPATIPAAVPYLAAEPAAAAAWRARLAGDALKVGLVWAGNPRHSNDRNRSIALEHLAPLLETPRARFYSLQVGARAGELAAAGVADRIVDLAPALGDFADTAAALAALDLLITVDTAAAHLAGALARPVWLLLPYVSDWRWLVARGDTPWYPTMRLFRQTRRGDWPGVVGRVRAALDDA